MSVHDGQAKYAYHFDFTKFSSSNCDISSLTNGLNYHIHSYSVANENAGTTSSADPSVCTLAGGHYDPSFACSASSESIATSCAAIGRNSLGGYNYQCSNINFQNGQVNACELGDLSGKFGPILDDNNDMIYTSGGFVNSYDPIPVYDYNFKAYSDRVNPPIGQTWASLVVHCGQTTTRVLCADFSTTDLNSCSSAFEELDSLDIFAPIQVETSSTRLGLSYGAAVTTTVLICLFGSILIGFLLIYYAQYIKSEAVNNSSANQSLINEQGPKFAAF